VPLRDIPGILHEPDATPFIPLITEIDPPITANGRHVHFIQTVPKKLVVDLTAEWFSKLHLSKKTIL
jgi:hypothetical protein